MNNRAKRVTAWALSLALMVTCALSGLILPTAASSQPSGEELLVLGKETADQRAEGGVPGATLASVLSPNTGEKPSATPYILGGIMVLCVVVIVILFLPKKNNKQQDPPTDSDHDAE